MSLLFLGKHRYANVFGADMLALKGI